MRLRWKIGLLVGAIVVLGTTIAVLVASTVVADSFRDLERQRALDDAHRAYGFLEQQYAEMRSTSLDWSEWDDTYLFAGGEDPGYVAGNITPDTFRTLRLDAIGFIDQAGRLSSLLTPDGPVPLDRAPEAVRVLFPGGVIGVDGSTSGLATAGVVVPPAGDPMVVSLSGILRSDRSGPRRGTLMMCRALDADVLSSASAYLRLPLRIVDGAAPAGDGTATAVPRSRGVTYSATVIDDDHIAGYAVVPDMRGRATLTLQTEDRRAVSQAGETTSVVVMLGMACVAIVSGLGFLLVLDRTVRKPLTRLADDMFEIEQDGDYSGRVSAGSGDEIGDVAAAANRMLEALGGARVQLEESERRFRALFESSPVATIEIDASGVLDVGRRIRRVEGDLERYLDAHPEVIREVSESMHLLAVNPTAAAVFGARSVDQYKEGFRGLMAQGPVRRAMAQSFFSLVAGADASGFDVDMIRLDDTPACLHFDWRLDENSRLLVTAADVTAARVSERSHEEMREQLEDLVDVRTAELDQTNRELREATQTKDRFLANMSHELRTPLNSVIGFSGLLSSGMAGPLNEEQSRQVRMIRASGERLLALVTEILDLSRLESGVSKPELTDFDIGMVLESLVDSLRPAAAQKGLDLSLLLPPAYPIVRTDRSYFDGIVLNIVGNAIKHTERGSVTVALATPDDDLELRVTDTGPGIPEDELESIFEDFRQLAGRYDTKPQGAGLGLAISRRYAALLGGRIEVASTLGEGSEFTLIIPMTLDESTE